MSDPDDQAQNYFHEMQTQAEYSQELEAKVEGLVTILNLVYRELNKWNDLSCTFDSSFSAVDNIENIMLLDNSLKYFKGVE